MIENKVYHEDGTLEAEFDCKYTDDAMEVIVNSDVDEKYAERCIEHFNNLSDDLLDCISEALCRYCEAIRYDAEDVFGDLGLPEKIEGREILNYCYPTSMSVEVPTSYNIVGYSIEGNCNWEPEHGFQLIIRDDKLISASPFEGALVWGDDDCYDSDFNFAL